MSDPWTLSLLDESSSTPAWSRLDPPRFSSILAGACHFSRKEKKKKKKKNRYAKVFGFGITGEPVLANPPLPIHRSFITDLYYVCVHLELCIRIGCCVM